MHSFLLSCRLYFLSRTLIRHQFSSSENCQTKNDLRQAQLSLYSDMLQYHEEHPDAGYRAICEHFADDKAEEILAEQHRQNILLCISALCLLIVIIGLLTLDWIANYILKNIPVSFSKM